MVTECFLWLRRLVVCFSPRVIWIQPGLVFVGFIMVKTALWQACSSASVFPYKCHSTNAPTSFSQLLFTITDEQSMWTIQPKRCFFGNRGERRNKFTLFSFTSPQTALGDCGCNGQTRYLVISGREPQRGSDCPLHCDLDLEYPQKFQTVSCIVIWIWNILRRFRLSVA